MEETFLIFNPLKMKRVCFM